MVNYVCQKRGRLLSCPTLNLNLHAKFVYQNVKRTELLYNVCATDFDVICLTN